MTTLLPSQRWFAALIVAAALQLPAMHAWSAEGANTGVSRLTYAGWENSLSMSGGDCKLVVVPAVGGRVMSYSVNNDNILYENREAFGRTLSNTPAGFSPGGYQCDLGPELRGIVPHQGLWIGSWLGRVPRPYVIHTVGPAEMSVGVQIDKEFTMDPETGEVGVLQRMRNIITSDTSFCLWDRTMCKAGGFALLPLNKKSQFKARWSIRQGTRGEYRYNGETPKDRRARVMDNVLVVQARELEEARELKVGSDAHDGWIAYVRGRVLFVKYFPVTPKGSYTDGGNTVEFYCNERIAELEPLSPEVRLQPGEEYIFPEKWVLVDLGQEITTFEQARAVVKQIEKSPFRER